MLNFRLKTVSVAALEGLPGLRLLGRRDEYFVEITCLAAISVIDSSRRTSRYVPVRPVMACFAVRVGNSGMVSNWLGPISDPCQDHAKWSITARQVTANNELRCIYGVAGVVSLMHGDSLTQSRRCR